MLKFKLSANSQSLVIFSPSIDHGGVEKNLFLITDFFSRNLKDVIVITSDFRDKKYFSKKIKVLTPPKNFIKFKNRILKNIICVIILLRHILKDKKFLLLSFNANLYATIIAKLFSIKILIRINASYKLWARNFLKKFIFNIFFKYPDEIIVNSLYLKKEIDKQFNIKSKCILNPFDKTRILKSKKSKKNLFGVEKKFLKILFLGRLVDQKDPFTFLKAINKIPQIINFKSLIVGSGYMKKDILKFINNNNLKDRLSHIDYTRKAMQYLNQCDLLILSSKYEGLPNVLLEAQFLKKYIISTNCPTGPREILLGGKAGDLIEVNNSEILKKKIIEYYKNRKKKFYKKKIALGYKKLYRFDFNSNCLKYLELIKKHL